MEGTTNQEAPVVSIAAQDLLEGDVLIEEGADYLILDVHERVSGVYVSAKREDVAGEDEFHFQFDEPVARRVLS